MTVDHVGLFCLAMLIGLGAMLATVIMAGGWEETSTITDDTWGWAVWDRDKSVYVGWTRSAELRRKIMIDPAGRFDLLPQTWRTWRSHRPPPHRELTHIEAL